MCKALSLNYATPELTLNFKSASGSYAVSTVSHSTKTDKTDDRNASTIQSIHSKSHLTTEPAANFASTTLNVTARQDPSDPTLGRNYTYSINALN